MEYVSGHELAGYVPATRRALYLCLFQIACGLADIHAANCIHRDIKPLNMRYDGSGIIKIIDFGIGSSNNPSLLNPAAAPMDTELRNMTLSR